MPGSDAEEFVSWARLKLVEDDYRILRRFRGESSLATYLTVVLSMLFRDYRVQRWGRWRPSAAARRLGPLALRLERLVRRDGFSLHQAAAVLRASGDALASDRELAAILAELPDRASLRPIEVDLDEVVPELRSVEADDAVEGQEARRLRTDVDDALAKALDRLPAEDRVLLRLRFWEGLSVADAARALGIPQKPVYRRLERDLRALREMLEKAGISREQARARLEEIVRASVPAGEIDIRAHLLFQDEGKPAGGA